MKSGKIPRLQVKHKATLSITDGKVKIDNANIVTVDVETSNGVIHVIDSVILPKG